MDRERETGRDLSLRMQATHMHNTVRAIEDFLGHPENWDDISMKRMARTCLPHKIVGTWVKLINKWYRCGFDPRKGAEDKFKTEISPGGGMIETNSQIIKEKFEEMCSVGFAEWVGGLPGHLQTYAKAPPLRVKPIGLRFYSDGTSIFNHNFKDSTTRLVLGQKGSGKTSFTANYMMPDDIQAGMLCVGNMKMRNMSEIGKNEVGLSKYVYADTLSETLIPVCKNGIEGIHTSRIYDEPHQSQARTTATSKKYLTQKNIYLTNRKLGMCDTGILQRRKDVPSELKDLCDIEVLKADVLHKGWVDVTIGNSTEYYVGALDTRQRTEELEQMGLPVFDYVSEWLSWFIVDFEYDQFFLFLRRELGRIDTDELVSKRQFRAILEFLESLEIESEVTEDQIARVAFDRHKALNISIREVARRMGWTHTKMLNRWKKLGLEA